MYMYSLFSMQWIPALENSDKNFVCKLKTTHKKNQLSTNITFYN